MQYLIALPAVVTDAERFAQWLSDEDASAVLDRAPDGRALRVSTCLTRAELQVLAARAGLSVGVDAIQALPSDCCGGCGG